MILITFIGDFDVLFQPKYVCDIQVWTSILWNFRKKKYSGNIFKRKRYIYFPCVQIRHDSELLCYVFIPYFFY